MTRIGYVFENGSNHYSVREIICFDLCFDRRRSTVTLINSKIIYKLGVKSSHADITLKGISDDAFTHSSAKINLELKYDSLSILMKNVLVVDSASQTMH